MLAGLGHRAVGSSNHDDCTVHLSSTGNHVLHIVSVSRAVNVSVMTVGGLVLYVSGVDCDTALLFLGSVVDLVERLNLGKTGFSKHGGDSGGKGSFTVVNVTNGTDVYMRFGSFEFLFSHNFAILIK